MKHLAVDSRMLHASGIGTYIHNLLPRVIEALPDVHFHLLGNLEELKGERFVSGHNVVLHRATSPIYSAREQLTLLRKIPSGCDCFWSPHYNIPLGYRGKLVVTVHDVLHLAMPQYVGGLHKRLYARFMFAAIKRKARAIVCDSEFTASEVVRLTGVDRSKVTVIHIGVDDSWQAVEKRKRPHPRPYLLYVGNVKPHKNLRGLIEALNLLAAKVPHDLVIVGRKEGFITGDSAVGHVAAQLGGRVKLTGFIDSHLLQQYYAFADLLALPSFYEGFGLPPLEAMACGCPSAVSNIASLPEICRDAALYFDPYDTNDIAEKIHSALTDTALRDRLVARGRERVKQFSWERTAEAFVRLLDRVAAE